MAGMTTSHANTPPEKITPAMRGPMMYPTPRYSVVVLARNEPPGSHFGLYVGVLGQTENMFSVWPSTPTYNPKWLPGGSFRANTTTEYLGVGYIIGPRIAGVIFSGGVFAWLVVMPAIKRSEERHVGK